LIEDILFEPLEGVFSGSFLGLIIDECETESCGVAICPLEVVHQRPGEVAANVNSIFTGSQGDVADVLSVVVASVDVIESTFFDGIVGVSPSVLGHDNLHACVPFVNKILHFPDAERRAVEPFVSFTFGSDQGAVSVIGEGPLTIPVPSLLTWSHLAVNEFAGVEILEVEAVVSSIDEGFICGGESRKATAEHILHRLGPVSEENRIEIHTNLPLYVPASCRYICRIRGIQGLAPICVQDNSDLSASTSLAQSFCLSESLDSLCVREDFSISNLIRLRSFVPCRTFISVVTVAWRMDSTILIAVEEDSVRLVQGGPVFGVLSIIQHQSLRVVIEHNWSHRRIQEPTVLSFN